VTLTAMVVCGSPSAGTDRRQGGRALAGREPVQPERAQRRRRKMIAWLFKKHLLAAVLAAVEGVAVKAITKVLGRRNSQVGFDQVQLAQWCLVCSAAHVDARVNLKGDPNLIVSTSVSPTISTRSSKPSA
jgi:hypothetical protein